MYRLRGLISCAINQYMSNVYKNNELEMEKAVSHMQPRKLGWCSIARPRYNIDSEALFEGSEN